MIGLSGWVAMDIQIVVLKSLYPYGDFMMTKKICGTPQVRGGDTELSKANCTFHQNTGYQGWLYPRATGSPFPTRQYFGNWSRDMVNKN